MTLPWMPAGLEDVLGTREELRAGKERNLRGPLPRSVEEVLGRRTDATLWGYPIIESDLVAPGEVLVVAPSPMIGGMAVIANTTAPDRYGDPSALARLIKPTPGYTRHTAGGREAARLNRQRARCLA